MLRTVSLEQVRTFVTVAETASVTRAASQLHVAQPALSRKLRALEDEVGRPLFLRTTRGMRLTAAGERFLPHAVGILAAVERAAAAARHD